MEGCQYVGMWKSPVGGAGDTKEGRDGIAGWARRRPDSRRYFFQTEQKAEPGQEFWGRLQSQRSLVAGFAQGWLELVLLCVTLGGEASVGRMSVERGTGAVI